MNDLSSKILHDDALNVFRNIDIRNELDSRKILITGASGLIGLNFLAYLNLLVKMGTRIQLFATTNTMTSEKLLSFYPELKKNAKCYTSNLAENFPEDIQKCKKFDFIFHCASYGQPGKFMAQKVNTLKLNTVTLFKLFDVLNENGRFLNISTSEIYSGNSSLLHDENMIGTTGPSHSRASYIEAKRCGETITNIYRESGINGVSARIALSYGPGVRNDDQRVLNQFILKALNESEINMLDSGSAVRTYCYISDTIEMLLNCAFKGRENVYNIAGISEVSILELANLIGKKMNVIVRSNNYSDSGLGAPQVVKSDISRYINEFGKDHFVDMYDGLDKCIDWYKTIN